MNFLAKEFADSVMHFASSGHSVGESENFLRLGVAFLDQVRDAVNEDRGLARTGASYYQHWSVHVLDGFALVIVGKEWSLRLFGDSHCGSEYHHAQECAGTDAVKIMHRKSERGQHGGRNGQRGDGGGFGAEDGISQRSGNPSGLLKGLDFVIGPSTFRTDGQRGCVRSI